MSLRSVESQFEARDAARIRDIQARLSKVSYPDSVFTLYASEARVALEAGALLAALGTTASLLEVAVRGLTLLHIRKAAKPELDLQQALEQRKGPRFQDLVDHLVAAGLFSTDDADTAKEFYTSVRIPVHHGLPARFVRNENPGWTDIRLLMGKPEPVHMHDLEDVLQDRALAHIETVVGVLERNCVGSA